MSLPPLFTTVNQHVTLILVRFGRIPLLVILLWTATLWWGERTVFRRSAAACEWATWESWPAEATPHHVLFIADPQLVDPHTYPGRPWPLSTLTVLYTDLYMRRVYRYLLEHTQPHTTMFLGDLFDGGREWAASDYESPEDRYKKYGNAFWLREYHRFMSMFVDGWYEHDWKGHLTGEGRKIIASLPGNHDLGFAGGINEHVRDRFEAHFGPSNRIDILGNHTFVSLDTVSLSAMDQVDPKTGSSGAGDGTGQSTKHMEIWKPVEAFLMDAKNRRAKAVERRYQHFKSTLHPESTPVQPMLLNPKVTSLPWYTRPRVPDSQKDMTVSSSSFPTILLTHVPLYRNQDVTCGPMRERGNAIPLAAGYQYQNVLTPAVSKDIIDHLDAEQIAMIYSGDDHDYCEIEHGEFTGRIKEITVKSISWAMGVRKPGVQLASLWNPIDMDAISRSEAAVTTPRDTIQNHLCLLPDQLAIFIRYGLILGLTLIVLLVRAVIYNSQQAYQQLAYSPVEKDKLLTLLPLSKKQSPPSSPQLPFMSSNNTSTPSHTARSRSNGKVNGYSYGNIPNVSRSNSPAMPSMLEDDTANDWGIPKISSSVVGTGNGDNVSYVKSQTASFSSSFPSVSHRATSSSVHKTVSNVEALFWMLTNPAGTKSGEFLRSMCIIAFPVLIFYFWLLWNG